MRGIEHRGKRWEWRISTCSHRFEGKDRRAICIEECKRGSNIARIACGPKFCEGLLNEAGYRGCSNTRSACRESIGWRIRLRQARRSSKNCQDVEPCRARETISTRGARRSFRKANMRMRNVLWLRIDRIRCDSRSGSIVLLKKHGRK